MRKVSIITPTYNHKEYIEQCIKSVLAQTYQNWEQIIIDDGSTDGTGDAIRKYQNPRIRFYHQSNIGIYRLAETYNKALDLAEGELIAILEGDDFWPANKLETLVTAFDNPEIILAYGFALLVTASGKEIAFTIPTSWFLKHFPTRVLFNEPIGSATCTMARSDVRTFTFPCSVIIRTETLRKIGGFQNVPGLPFVDFPTFITLGLQGKFFFTPQIMGYWRQHVRSNTQTRDEERTNYLLRDFVLKFLDTNQKLLMLPMSVSELHRIEKTWERIPEESAFSQGRRLLLMKEWKRARSQFIKTLKTEKRPKRWVAAIVGYFASWLHLDIETLFILAKGRGSSLKNVLISNYKDKNSFKK